MNHDASASGSMPKRKMVEVVDLTHERTSSASSKAINDNDPQRTGKYAVHDDAMTVRQLSQLKADQTKLAAENILAVAHNADLFLAQVELTAELAQTKAELARTKSELAHAKADMTKANAELHAMHAKLKTLDDVNKARAKVNELKIRLEQAYAEVNELMTRLDEAKAEVNEKNVEVNQKRAELNDLKVRLEQEQHTVRAIREQLDAVHGKLKAKVAKISLLEVQLARAQAQAQAQAQAAGSSSNNNSAFDIMMAEYEILVTPTQTTDVAKLVTDVHPLALALLVIQSKAVHNALKENGALRRKALLRIHPDKTGAMHRLSRDVCNAATQLLTNMNK